MRAKKKDASDIIKEMVRKSGNRVSRQLAADMLEAILADGIYSEEEQIAFNWLRTSDDISFDGNTEKWLGRQLSIYNLTKHREEMQRDVKENLVSQLMEKAGKNPTISMDDARNIIQFIKQDGRYSEQEQETMEFLYNSGRMGAKVENYIKNEIANWRSERAHNSWMNNEVENRIMQLLGVENFSGIQITEAIANSLLSVIFQDGQYSIKEKSIINELYRNANWATGTKESFIAKIRSWKQVFAINGEVVHAFKKAVESIKRSLSVNDVRHIGRNLHLGSGRDASVHRTLSFCRSIFTFTSELAEETMDELIKKDLKAKASKRIDALNKIKEAAESQPPKEMEAKSSGEKYTPSKTLIAKYEELKNKRGQITMRTAEEFVGQLFLDHKYTRNEQVALQEMRDEEVFTVPANKYITYRIRKFVVSKNST